MQKRRQHKVDKEQAKRVRQFMRDSGIKHYIYGIGTFSLLLQKSNTGQFRAKQDGFPSKQADSSSKTNEILSNKLDVEIHILHINA